MTHDFFLNLHIAKQTQFSDLYTAYHNAQFRSLTLFHSFTTPTCMECFLSVKCYILNREENKLASLPSWSLYSRMGDKQKKKKISSLRIVSPKGWGGRDNKQGGQGEVLMYKVGPGGMEMQRQLRRSGKASMGSWPLNRLLSEVRN
jgi:hypothetical protein